MKEEREEGAYQEKEVGLLRVPVVEGAGVECPVPVYAKQGGCCGAMMTGIRE